MLPRKRAADDGEVVIEPDTKTTTTNNNNNNNCNAAASSFKKHRLDNCIIAAAPAAATESTAKNGVNGARIGGNSDQTNCIVVESSPSIMALGDANHTEIDEDLHSRQLAVYGRETMRRLFASNILVSGMQGLGAEIAKNLILAGVKSVTLHDEGLVDLWDLSSNFVFSESDVGKNRALASVQKLQELNNAVIISTLTTKLTKEKLSDFQAVVFTDISFEKAIEFSDYCHNHQPPISFIKAEVRGLFGSIFCDFGPEFTVIDVDGEDPHTGIIASISNDNPALVSCVDDERLEFQDGDLVVFSEVHGMTELNGGKPRKIKSARPYSPAGSRSSLFGRILVDTVLDTAKTFPSALPSPASAADIQLQKRYPNITFVFFF
ncbi:ubiquitin-activating enzyme E1 2-like [Herrania umbratica]|uniref:Ubiquitin-activating enzyme E1 2-like n=1 Tax=Herrania umbratica TaxID=108875 RepID=A0A6J0ZXL9_9ROSI|nr:ubiquitin-activating enzyme E1 2-like [Herrania umbratica]